MKFIKHAMTILVTAISLSAAANEVFLSEANLSAEQIEHFKALPEAAQKMMVNDFLKAKKLRALAEKSKAKKQFSLQASGVFKSTAKMDHCDEEDDPDEGHYTCVPNCTVRGSSGSCYSYGSDYCDVGASCAMNCTVRGSSGSCYSYGADYCGSYATCSENCTVRGSDGSCYSYGADICY